MMVPFLFSLKEYEDKAVSLALNRPKLQELSDKLKAARMTCPLFDTARWVRFFFFSPFFYLCLIGTKIFIFHA